jgi:hypothetical protein
MFVSIPKALYFVVKFTDVMSEMKIGENVAKEDSVISARVQGFSMCG